jgi:hypothetical protein
MSATLRTQQQTTVTSEIINETNLLFISKTFRGYIITGRTITLIGLGQLVIIKLFSRYVSGSNLVLTTAYPERGVSPSLSRETPGKIH